MDSSSSTNDTHPEVNSGKIKFDADSILNNLPTPILLCDLDGIITYFNVALNEICLQDLKIGKSIFDFNEFEILDIYSEQPSSKDKFLQDLFKTNVMPPNVMAQFKCDLSKSYIIESEKIEKSKDQSYYRFCFLPISKLKHDVIKETVLSSIVESSDDAIISKDLNGYIISWNKAAKKIFGYTEQEIVGQHINILIPKNRIKDENNHDLTIRRGDKVERFETVRLNKQGEEILLSITISPIIDAKGRIIGESKIAKDISDRYKQEEKQSRLSAIVESSDDAIISKDLNGIITSWNYGAYRIFGYTEEEVIGKSVTMLIPQNRLREENIIINNVKEGKRIHHFETKRLNKKGKKIPVSLSISPIKDNKGNIIGASKIARDIKSQKKSKQKIKRYNQKLEILNTIGKEITSNLDVNIVLQKVTDATTKLSGAKFGAFFYNSEDDHGEAMMLYTLSGASKEDFEKLGMPRHTQVFKPTFSGQGVLRIDDITADERYAQNTPHKGMPTGHLKVVSYMAIPVITSSGRVIGGLIFGHPEKGKFLEEHENIVKNIASQAAIALDNSILFERVKSLSEKKDEFIALASHELKTPLTTIIGYLQVLEKKIEEPMSQHFIAKTLEQTHKLNSLIEDLLNMSRIESGKLEFNREQFDLKETLEDISETFNYGDTTHTLITNLGNDPIIITADKQRLEQVVRNLLSNAVKYSPFANEIFLDLKAENGIVTVKVKDTGIGLSTAQQKQVFNRFYRAETTKGINGLGLGLYLTKQIIDAHGGELHVESTIGKGSEFSFSLKQAI